MVESTLIDAVMKQHILINPGLWIFFRQW